MTLKAHFRSVTPAFLMPYWDRLEASPLGYRLARGAFWSLAGAMISRSMGLVSSILVARMLGKVGFGELGIIQGTVGMLGLFAGFGLGITATKHVAEFRIKDPARAGRIIALSSLVSWITGGVMAVILVVAGPWLAAHTLAAPHLGGMLRVGSLLLLLGAVNGAQTGALSGFEAFKSIARINLISGFAAFPLMVAGAWWRGLEGAVLGQVISQTLNCALNFFCLRAEARRARVPLAYTGALSEMSVLLRFSLPVVLTGLFAGPVNWLCSSMLVNLPNGYEQLGIYNAANQWRIALAFLAGILAQVALPILASASKCGGCHERQRALRVILGVSVSAVILPSVILIALAPGIVQLYGKSFGISPGLFVLLIVAESLASIGSILYTCLLSLQRAWLGLVGNVMWIAVLLTTFRLLITYQAVGLAWAQVISYLVSLIIITPPILFHLVYRKHPK